MKTKISVMLEAVRLLLFSFLMVYGITFILTGWVQTEHVKAVPNFLFGFGVCAVSLYFIILEFQKV